MFKEIKSDLPASIVVFFVAVPLCLGIALASGAPLFSGIIAGIVGGIIVGWASGSPLGVTGPAAGLAVIVFSAIKTLGSYETFLLSVVIAGVIQLILGYAKAGFVAYFFPSSVIKGMLTGIGLLIILKQIPHAFGWDKDSFGDTEFFQADGQNTFTELFQAFEFVTPGALLISGISLGILILWDKVMIKKHKVFTMLNGPLVVVIFGIIMNYLYQSGVLNFMLTQDQLVRIPVPENFTGFLSQFSKPNFSAITNPDVWKIGIVIAVVASLETLLCVEATDKMDPNKGVTPTNRELKAQGLGNLISGMIGGLPVTQVIVRSSANIAFGGKTKMSAILHGVFLLISAITIASLLNCIPLASLAAILLMVGYKLAKPELFKQMYRLGSEQFIPFMVTIIAILATDLLKGIMAGMIVGIFYALYHGLRNSHKLTEEINQDHSKSFRIELAEEVTFFNKASVVKALESIPINSKLIIDGSKSVSIAYDIKELIKDFIKTSEAKNIKVESINFDLKD